MFKSNCFLPRILMDLCKVKKGKNLRLIGWPFVFRFKNASVTIGNDVSINSNFWSNLLGVYQRTIIVARGTGKIKIGDGVGISGSTIYAWDDIEIGDKCIIGVNTKIVDTDFHPIDPVARQDKDYHSKVACKPVKIGKNVFIGMNTLILKGTEIGDNCVVGAGSVVSGRFPENSVIAGNPAKVIRSI